MPFIHFMAWSGKDDETKKKTAQALMKAASEAMGAPESAFTIVYEDIEKENWEKDVAQTIIEPLKDKIFISRGETV